jgi:hypothetical protein
MLCIAKSKLPTCRRLAILHFVSGVTNTPILALQGITWESLEPTVCLLIQRGQCLDGILQGWKNWPWKICWLHLVASQTLRPLHATTTPLCRRTLTKCGWTSLGAAMADQVAGWYWPSEIGWFNLVGQAVQWQERLMDLKLYTSCTIYDNKEEQKLRFDVWTMFASGWRILRRA